VSATAHTEARARYLLRCAQWSCLALGAGLLAWGITPLIVERMTSHDPPLLETFLLNGVTLLMGGTFTGLYVLIGRGVSWALWVAVCLSTVLIASTLAVSLASGSQPLPLFPLVLASCVSLTSWLAILSRRVTAGVSQPHHAG
jgi:hypothetical protein